MAKTVAIGKSWEHLCEAVSAAAATAAAMEGRVPTHLLDHVSDLVLRRLHGLRCRPLSHLDRLLHGVHGGRGGRLLRVRLGPGLPGLAKAGRTQVLRVCAESDSLSRPLFSACRSQSATRPHAHARLQAHSPGTMVRAIENVDDNLQRPTLGLQWDGARLQHAPPALPSSPFPAVQLRPASWAHFSESS